MYLEKAYILKLLFILTLLGNVQISTAMVDGNVPDSLTSHYIVHDLFLEEELESSSNFVYDILQDKNQQLWIATRSSLIFSNASEKKIFTNDPENPYFINAEKITHLFEDHQDNILFFYYDGKIGISSPFQNLHVSQKSNFQDLQTQSNFKCVFQDEENHIYIVLGKQQYLSVYKMNDNFVFEQIANKKFDENVASLEVSGTSLQNTIFLGIAGKGVMQIQENASWKQIHKAIKPKDHPILLEQDGHGQLWLCYKNTDHLETLSAIQSSFAKKSYPGKQAIAAMKKDEIGNLIFLSGEYPKPSKEAYLYTQQNGFQLYAFQDKLERSPYYCYSHDFTKNLFTASISGIQLIELKNKFPKAYLDKVLNNEWGNIIKGIAEDNNGDIYFLSESHHFFKLNTKTSKIDTLPIKEKGSGKVYDFTCGANIEKDKQGNLWFCVCIEDGNCLIKFNPNNKKFELFRFDEIIRCLSISDNQDVFIIHENAQKEGAVSVFNQEKAAFTLISNENNRFAQPRFSLIDNNNQIWIGTVKGLVKLHLESKERKIYKKENSNLPNDHIMVIYQKEDGNLLLGSSGGGLIEFDVKSEKIKKYTEKEGLCNNKVCGIIHDDENNYWISTFNGVSYFQEDLGIFISFNQEDGFSHFEFNRYGFYKSTKNEIYLGSLNGANSFSKNDLLNFNASSISGISRIGMYYGQQDSMVNFNYQEDLPRNLVLNSKVSYIEFQFFITDFVKSDKANFLVKLEGYDAEWNNIGPNRKVKYKKLPAGTYTLKYKAFDHNGFIAKNSGAYTFTQKEIYYKQPAFILVFISSLLLLSFLAYQNRINKIKHQEKEKSRTNKLIAELELKALQSQLNPHFIFNSLGAVQYFIQMNDKEEADKYLSKFALLMRLFLESSKSKYISLKDELKLIELYVDLESLRYKDKFEFELIVDPAIELHSTLIPSMMLQPFIENAINHGIFHKVGTANLKLELKLNHQNEILYIIEDDGVGRVKAQEIKAKSTKNYKSRAMQIINERIEVLSNVENCIIDIDIKDLYDDNKISTGTKVEILIPEIE